jgi:hypothetical protein
VTVTDDAFVGQMATQNRSNLIDVTRKKFVGLVQGFTLELNMKQAKSRHRKDERTKRSHERKIELHCAQASLDQAKSQREHAKKELFLARTKYTQVRETKLKKLKTDILSKAWRVAWKKSKHRRNLQHKQAEL